MAEDMKTEIRPDPHGIPGDAMQQARKVAASYSEDADECRMFLAMLGLDAIEVPESEPAELVDAEPARAHVRSLYGSGRGLTEIAKASDVPRNTIHALVYGMGSEPPPAQIADSVAQALLAVQFDAPQKRDARAESRAVRKLACTQCGKDFETRRPLATRCQPCMAGMRLAGPSQEHLRKLRELEVTWARLGEACGLPTYTVRNIGNGKQQYVLPVTERKILALTAVGMGARVR